MLNPYAIMCKIINSTQKYPKRVKVYLGGKKDNFVFNEAFSDWENCALSVQSFCRDNDLKGGWHAAKCDGGMVFVQVNDEYWVDEYREFNDEE
jgi:hypothetical protein